MRTPLVLALLLLASPAAAGATPWQELAPGVRARLISSDVVTAGKTTAGLELDMPGNTKTYWRIPGETGIPTEFDFAGSSGVSVHRPVWPYPVIDRSQGYLDYVYYGPTVLPLDLVLNGSSALLQASVTMGICTDICIPASATFSLPLTSTGPDSGQEVRLDQALALAPFDWDQPQPPFGAVGYDATTHALTVANPDPMIDLASLIVDTGDPAVLFGAPKKSPDGQLIEIPLLGNGDLKGLTGRQIQITFMTALGAYAVTRQIAP